MLHNDGRFPLKVVPLSKNAKIGIAAATYRPVGDTCPLDCFLLSMGPATEKTDHKKCYAQRHHVGIHARKSANDYHELDRVLSSGVSLIRHHVSGDFFKNDQFDAEYFEYVVNFHRRNPRLHGYAYTHRIADILDYGITFDSLPSNFTLMASLDPNNDTPELRARVHAAGFHYTRVHFGSVDESLAERKKNEVVCPNQLSRHYGKTPVTCSQCKLCTHGKTDVVFLNH